MANAAATKEQPVKSSKSNELMSSQNQNEIRRAVKAKHARKGAGQHANRETMTEGLRKDRIAESELAAETARIQQVDRATKALNLENSFDEYVTMQFMLAWLEATPTRSNGVVVKSRTATAKKVITDGLPQHQANSRQVHDLLRNAGAAIYKAGNDQD